MEDQLVQAREHFIQGMSRISQFWGFPRAMGAIFGAIYLSQEPLSLDELVAQAAVSKGAVSTNVRHLERLGMVHKHIQVGSRKDFYVAETDFWQIIKTILQEREKGEFDLALRTVGESLVMVSQVEADIDTEQAAFYAERMQAMEEFFQTLDSLVATVMKLENLMAFNALGGLVKRTNKSAK